MKNLIKLSAFIALLGLVIFPTYAVASSNPASKIAGEGAGPISGWTVSDIKYQLSRDPSLVSSVGFDLDKSAGTVSVKLNSGGMLYTNCSHTSGFHWQCDFPAGIQLTAMDEFRVIAVGN